MISGPRYKDPADQPTDFNKKKSEMFFVDIYSWGERILTLFFCNFLDISYNTFSGYCL